MTTRFRLLVLAAPLALAQLSCAAGGSFTPLRESMPAARAALQPEYRLFYDALVEEGAWVLIEPYGYLFRPRVSFESWRPYGNGFWVPTDIYGWVWVSTEPFGWATYHYGQWLYDPYQGWVWRPGLQWAPAWVIWETNDSYAGWAALSPTGAPNRGVPGGPFSFVSVRDLGSTDLPSKVVRAQELGDRLAGTSRVENRARVEGVTIDLGPSIEWVEEKTGPLKRAKVSDLLPGNLGSGSPRDEPSAGRSTGGGAADTLAATRRAVQQALRQARGLGGRASAIPEHVEVVRPFGGPASPSSGVSEPAGRSLRPMPGRGRSARPDSTR